MQFLEMEVLSVNCNTSLSHTVVVRIFHELRFRMFCAYCMPHISFLKHYAAKSHEFVECLVTGGETLVHHHILAMCKHWVEAFFVPMIEEFQGCEIFWQCDGYCVLGLKRCVVGRPHATGNNHQCRCILYDTGSIKSCHEMKMPWTASKMCFASSWQCWTAQCQNDLTPAAFLMGNLGTSGIQCWPGIEPLSFLSCCKGWSWWPRFQIDNDVEMAVIMWLQLQHADFCKQGNEKQVLWCDLCLCSAGDYIEQ